MSAEGGRPAPPAGPQRSGPGCRKGRGPAQVPRAHRAASCADSSTYGDRFLPGPGTITRWEEPTGEGIRVDAGYAAGDTVTPYYDPLLAKLCVWGADRPAALERARQAVAGFAVEGPKCNLPFFVELLQEPEFVSGSYDTGLIARMRR